MDLTAAKTSTFLDFQQFKVSEGKLIRTSSSRTLEWYEAKPERVDANFLYAVQSISTVVPKFIRHVIRPYMLSTGVATTVFYEMKDKVITEVLGNEDLTDGEEGVFDAEFAVFGPTNLFGRSELDLDTLLTEEIIRPEINRVNGIGDISRVRVQGFQNEHFDFQEGFLRFTCVAVKLNPETGEYTVFAAALPDEVEFDEGKTGTPVDFENSYDIEPFVLDIGELTTEVLLTFLVIYRVKLDRNNIKRYNRSKVESFLIHISTP